MSSFGGILRRQLDLKGKAAKDLAEHLNLTPAAISKYMSGAAMPTPTNLEAIVEFLALTKGEADRLRRSAERARSPSSRPLVKGRMGRRVDVMRLADHLTRTVFRRIVKTCYWSLEEPPEGPVRCDALIRNPEYPDRSVALVFLFQWKVDIDECRRTAGALQHFYDGKPAILFYRPFLDEPVSQPFLVEESDWAIVYDWNLIHAIARHIPPTAEAKEYLEQIERFVRSELEA